MKEEGNYKIVENKDAHCSAVYMLWFSFILGSNFIFLCCKLIIIYYYTQKQRKIKFKPKTKLNHNIYNIKSHVIPASATKAGITEVSLKCHPVLRPTLQLEARKEPGLVTRWGGGGGWSKRGMTVQTTQR